MDSKLTKKQKLAHYKTPDYCIVTRAGTLKVLRLELAPLCEEKGFFFEVYHEVKVKKDIYKTEAKPEEMVRVVIFLDDIKIDTMAELLKVETRLKKYDCTLPFKRYAKDMFE
jgi:hypothetical protein